MGLFAPDRRWLTIASLTAMLVAGLHTLGQFSNTPEGSDVAIARLAMQNARVPMGMGMVPSVWDLFRGLAFTMSITVFGLALLTLLVSADPQASRRLVRRAAAVMAIVALALTALYWSYQITPPLISFVVVTMLYAVAAAKA